MSEFPKVTIMIPTYNQEEYIAEAIESALSQDYPNLEVIVTDDCSKDRTGEIAKRYTTDPRFRYILNETNLGRVGNYHNTLYTHATGEWVINLDGDDYYTDSKFISRAMNRVIADPDIVCHFAKKYISQNLSKYINNQIAVKTFLFDGKEYFKEFFNIGGFAHAGALYKRDIAIKDKLCYTFDGIQSDFHGIIRLVLHGKIILSQDDGYKWRVHHTNATMSVNNKQKYKSELICQQRIIQDLQSNLISDTEKKNWLDAGKIWARKQYCLDCMNLENSLHGLGIGLKHFQFNIPYSIMMTKSLLRYIKVL